MELVKGVPITKFCDEHRLSPRQRLALFVSVCHAIQHAHQKGIIHRDIKPNNVLVAAYDGEPVVKVIDFGVAKATGQRLTERTLFTEFGAIIGTLEYMSPEQAELNNQDIDTRSDIYSLGVLLYELLTGTTPLQRERFKATALVEVLRVIREEEPPKPSTRLSASSETLPAISAQRRTEPAKLRKIVRGELDWIVMKALEKDRNRRYETANGLAVDIQRYLQDQPVQAGPPSTWYRFRKFARRNQAMLGTAAAIGVLLVVATTLLGLSNARLGREQESTKHALAAETQAKNELQDTLEREQRNLARLHVALANSLWMAAEADEAKRHLEQCEPRFRDSEWQRLSRACRAELVRLHVHFLPLYKVCFSHDGRWLATLNAKFLSAVPEVRVWDALTGECRHTMSGDMNVVDLTFSADSKFLIMAGLRGNDAEPRVEIRRRDLASSVETSSDFRIVAPAPKPETARAVLQPGNLASMTGILVYSPPLVLSGDGRQLAVGSADGQEVRVWDTATGNVLSILRPPAGTRIATSITFTPNGKSVVTTTWTVPRGALRPRLTLWDTQTGQIARLLDLKNVGANAMPSPDGRKAALIAIQAWMSDPGQIQIWDLTAQREVATVRAAAGAASCPTFSPDGRRLACVTGDTVVLIRNLETGREELTLRGHSKRVTSLAFSPDGRRLASGGDDATVRIWDISPIDEPVSREQ